MAWYHGSWDSLKAAPRNALLIGLGAAAVVGAGAWLASSRSSRRFDPDRLPSDDPIMTEPMPQVLDVAPMQPMMQPGLDPMQIQQMQMSQMPQYNAPMQGGMAQPGMIAGMPEVTDGPVMQNLQQRDAQRGMGGVPGLPGQ